MSSLALCPKTFVNKDRGTPSANKVQVKFKVWTQRVPKPLKRWRKVIAFSFQLDCPYTVIQIVLQQTLGLPFSSHLLNKCAYSTRVVNIFTERDCEMKWQQLKRTRARIGKLWLTIKCSKSPFYFLLYFPFLIFSFAPLQHALHQQKKIEYVNRQKTEKLPQDFHFRCKLDASFFIVDGRPSTANF